jgi:asparagine synthase (glutamine-hydrolysing)
MCGIGGRLGPEGQEPGDARLRRSLDAMWHRGPDELVTWARPGVGLAHARLAIIDRSHGEQPMTTRDGRYVVVFNGEIYNHQELRKELIDAGCDLSTNCDTEVLPYLYALHGPDMVDRLRGMFAFAVIDLVEREAFLARDRFGKKPLYVAAGTNAVSFASTLDALVPLLASTPEIDAQAIAEYMVLQYVPEDRSPWAGVEKLPPGHWLRWRAGSVERRRYWRPPLPETVHDVDAAQARRQLRLKVREAVELRLESEVPLGVFLSGGLDSSAVVAEMTEIGAPVSSYSVGFEQGRLDESEFARMVARRFGTDHHVLRVESDAPALLDALGEAYDEPFADSSALATLAVARAAKEHVTVVLTGDGGDELFGGYDRYRAMRMAGNLRRRLGPMAAAAGRAGGIASRVPGAGRLAAASGFLRDPWAGYRDRMFHFTPTEVRRLLHPDLAAQVDVWAPVRRLDRLWADAGSQPWVPWIDAQSYLPDDLLTKMDRATMAFGVEARSPLLDHELWTWAATLPRDLLIDRKAGKRLMREAYRGVLPDPVIDRAKMGFGVPLGAWLRSHLRSRLVAAPTGPLAGIVDPVAARAVVDRVLRGDDAFMYRAWNLLALATWLERRVAS